MSQDLSFDEAETACDTRVDGDSEFDKDEMKVIKRFCGRLLEEAHEDWEDHEKAKLVLLIQSNLAMSERKFWKWLIKHADPSAELVACLGDNGLTVQATSLVQMFGRGSFPHVISRMESSFEAGILDITSDDVLQSIYDTIVQRFSNHEILQLVRTISVFTSNKKRFGQLVNIFCAHITAYELVPILVDLLHFEVVSDLEGTVDSLLSQISYLDEDTRNQVRSRFKINEKGNIVASDEDDNGNLKDFVCDDDEISICSSALLESSWDEEYSDWEDADEDSDCGSERLRRENTIREGMKAKRQIKEKISKSASKKASKEKKRQRALVDNDRSSDLDDDEVILLSRPRHAEPDREALVKKERVVDSVAGGSRSAGDRKRRAVVNDSEDD